MNKQTKTLVNEGSMKEAIKSFEKLNIFESPVWRILNCSDDIVKAVNVCAKVEKFAELFPDNKLLQELLK